MQAYVTYNTYHATRTGMNAVCYVPSYNSFVGCMVVMKYNAGAVNLPNRVCAFRVSDSKRILYVANLYMSAGYM